MGYIRVGQGIYFLFLKCMVRPEYSSEIMGFPSEVELDEYVEECIGYTIGLPLCGKALEERLAQAEEGQRELREKVVYLNQRLQQTQQKLDRARAEANLNAQAVRKCVCDNEKGAERYRKLRDECTRLESECALYLHDREVFMEAADEAEERANEAEERVLQAENKVQELASQVQHLKQGMSHSTASKLKMAEELNSLRCRIRELESGNHSLQDVSTMTKKNQDDCFTHHQIEQLERENRELRALLDIATSRSEEQLKECLNSKQNAKEDSWREQMLVNSLVSSAVAKGLCKATEQEKKEAIGRIYSNLEAVIKEMGSELHGRLEVSEKKAQLLNIEVQSLRQEKNSIKSNLEKAEIEVQLLDEENKELRLLLRGKYQGSDGCVISPLQTKVKVSCHQKSQLKSTENICDMKGNDILRQPLTALAQNAAESRVQHR